MNSDYKVFWSAIAEKDLISIIEFISEESPRNALNILQKIRNNASDLNIFPERGRIVPELQDQSITHYHELIITPWRLIYKISGHEVFVLSVIDSRQNVEDILLRRFVHEE
jgi:toxin ParE1/3/4